MIKLTTLKGSELLIPPGQIMSVESYGKYAVLKVGKDYDRIIVKESFSQVMGLIQLVNT